VWSGRAARLHVGAIAERFLFQRPRGWPIVSARTPLRMETTIGFMGQAEGNGRELTPRGRRLSRPAANRGPVRMEACSVDIMSGWCDRLYADPDPEPRLGLPRTAFMAAAAADPRNVSWNRACHAHTV
jgi:hypothetical protein